MDLLLSVQEDKVKAIIFSLLWQVSLVADYGTTAACRGYCTSLYSARERGRGWPGGWPGGWPSWNKQKYSTFVG